MSTHTVSISRNDRGGWNIAHDGHDIADAINAQPAPTLSLDLDVPVLTASLDVGDLEVDGATLELRVPGHVRDALVAAGWTEPKEETVKAVLAGLVQRARKAKESRIDAQDFEGAKPWREVEAGLLAVLASLDEIEVQA